ncbi:MAG: hypothetical protein ACXVDN_09895 [Ktedonobacteraceae bacterium]
MKQDKFLRKLKPDDHPKMRATKDCSMNKPSRPVYSRGLPLRSPWGRGGVFVLLASLFISLIIFLFPAHSSAFTKKSSKVLPTLQLSVGFEDDSRVNYWTRVQVVLGNKGSNFSGVLSVTTYSGPSRQFVPSSTLSWGYQSPVVLPHGVQKHINFNIPFYETPAEPQGIIATLSDDKGKVVTTQTATPFILHSDSLLIGILSDYTAESPEFSSLSKVALPDPERSVELATLNASTMPDVAEVLDNFDVIVLDNFPMSTLNHAQLNALQTWINRGGSFIVIGGPDWQRTLDALPPQLLPVNVQGTGMLPPATRVLPIGSPTIAETGQTAASDSLPQSISISTATLPANNDMRRQTFSNFETVLGTASNPLIVQAHQGQGIVCYVAFDPAVAPLTNWIGTIALWKGLLLRTLGDQSLLPASAPTYSGGPGQSILRGGLFQILQPGTPFPAWILLILLLGYIIVLGPIRFFYVLLTSKGDRRKRAYWNWRIIGSSIIVFSFLTYSFVYLQKRPVINSISVIQLNQGSNTTHITNFYSTFIPDNGNILIHVPAKSLTQPITNTFLQSDAGIPDVDQNDSIGVGQNETNINIPNASPWTFHRFVSETDQKLQGSLSSSLVLYNGTLTGTVTNTLGTDVNDVYILLNHSFSYIGNLPAQQTRHIASSLNSSAMNSGSTLADQIAESNRLPVPFFPFAHGSQPKNDFQLHLAILSALSGEGMNYIPCGGPCSSNAIAGKHSIIAPLSGRSKLIPFDGNDPLLLTGSQATLIGWANNRIDTTSNVTVNGASASGTFEDFIQAPLNIDLSQSSSIPPGLVYGQVINAQGNEEQMISPGIYTINTGSITFEFALPTGGISQVNNLRISLPKIMQLTGINQVSARLYNWNTHSWDVITINQNSFTTTNSKAYTSSDGRVLLQVINQNASQGILYFGRPSLSLNDAVN